MVVYVVLVFALTFFVDLLLILETNRLSSHPPGTRRAVLAALVSGVYATGCLEPSCAFLATGPWRILALGITAAVAFGLSRWAVRQGLIWLMLKFALHGAATAFGGGSVGSVLLAACAIAGLYVWGFAGGGSGQELIPVELNYLDRHWKLTALRDTGNTLRDPITGEQVLVAGADMGLKLLGLSSGQLSTPVETLAAGLAPGMRLIPYRTIGQGNALMLALRLNDVKVGSWRGSALVAFAPECFENSGSYQMLVGGAMG